MYASVATRAGHRRSHASCCAFLLALRCLPRLRMIPTVTHSACFYATRYRAPSFNFCETICGANTCWSRSHHLYFFHVLPLLADTEYINCTPHFLACSAGEGCTHGKDTHLDLASITCPVSYFVCHTLLSNIFLCAIPVEQIDAGLIEFSVRFTFFLAKASDALIRHSCQGHPLGDMTGFNNYMKEK